MLSSPWQPPRSSFDDLPWHAEREELIVELRRDCDVLGHELLDAVALDHVRIGIVEGGNSHDHVDDLGGSN